MCLLRLSGQDWRVNYYNDPRKSPKGKLPVLNDNGTLIPDSDAIRDHLERKYDVDFDAGLNAEQRATSRAIIRMSEEHIYFAAVCNRWLNDENWANVRQVLFRKVPKIIRGVVSARVRVGVRKAMYAQGMGRHTAAEQFIRADKDISAIQTLLGNKPFLFGDRPTAADVSVVPMLRAIVGSSAKTALHERVVGDAVLMAYLERGKDAMYPP